MSFLSLSLSESSKSLSFCVYAAHLVRWIFAMVKYGRNCSVQMLRGESITLALKSDFAPYVLLPGTCATWERLLCCDLWLFWTFSCSASADARQCYLASIGTVNSLHWNKTEAVYVLGWRAQLITHLGEAFMQDGFYGQTSGGDLGSKDLLKGTVLVVHG